MGLVWLEAVKVTQTVQSKSVRPEDTSVRSSTSHMSYIIQTSLLHTLTCGSMLGTTGAHFRTSTILLQASTACCSLILPWTRLCMYRCFTKRLENSINWVIVILDMAACFWSAFQWTLRSTENRKSLLKGQNYAVLSTEYKQNECTVHRLGVGEAVVVGEGTCLC